MDWKAVLAALLSAVVAGTGGNIAGNSSAVAECGALLEQQRSSFDRRSKDQFDGFQATLSEIVKQIGQ